MTGKDRTCYKRGKEGQLAKVCRSKQKTQSPPGTKQRSHSAVCRVEENSADDSNDPSQPVLTVRDQRNCSPPIKIHVHVDNCSLLMEVDTGASVNIISETTFWSTAAREGLRGNLNCDLI